ncbi:M48 family metalloprotease [Streptomyces kunmingensis]|uniref:M48 family metalloprotease n=1 Tax=Streptomyces kunmingensis TaxID=68225 RepID=A0ABU6CJP4_9ACTN|nr:M48 family metalloprotease [Streptomyces kunmingensis]MEB3964945.1 M48 family metalloprotease [Streptomyces kunmingensis]
MPRPTDDADIPEEPTSARTPRPGSDDDLDYRHRTGRLHFSAHSRGLDATALGHLVLRLPGAVMSLLVVLVVSSGLDAWLGIPLWVPPLVWFASGALVFHRPTEDFLARHLLHLHRPLPAEHKRLAPVWAEVTARAGIDSRTYELWIEDSEDLNAYAAAGHIVGVTRFALDHLPTSQLAAVLAHELGHHTGGHVWSTLLGEWYALPGRLTWRAIRYLLTLAIIWSQRRSWSATALLLAVIGLVTFTTVERLYGLPLLLLATPYLTAAMGRRAELRADQHAAGLGFAQDLAVVLERAHQEGRTTGHATLAAAGGGPAGPGLLARLLDTHPDYPTRLHRLKPYL